MELFYPKLKSSEMKTPGSYGFLADTSGPGLDLILFKEEA
jgi:hypothetical protein